MDSANARRITSFGAPPYSDPAATVDNAGLGRQSTTGVHRAGAAASCAARGRTAIAGALAAALARSAVLTESVVTIKPIRLSPQYWALATFFIPIASAIAYGIWLGVSAAGLAHSTQSEEAVRAGALAILSAACALVPRAWARAVAISFGTALVLALLVLLQTTMLGVA